MNTSYIEAWNKARIAYQRRYAAFCKEFAENEGNEYCRGHMHEASYTLHFVYGLTDKEVDEVERNDGYTNADLEQEV